MAWTRSVSALAARSFSPTSKDIALKGEQQARAVRDLWIVLASVIGFLALVRFTRWGLSLLFKPTPPSDASSTSEKVSPESVEPGRSGKSSWRHIPAAFAQAFRIVAFRVHIPVGPGSVASVSELTFILGYIGVMFAFLVMDSKDFFYWFIEDRAAHLASCQLPIIVALAGKNNIISFLTGVGHEKLNILHRAAARTCLILLWCHAISRAVAGLPEKFDFTHDWVRAGALGLTAFTLAAIFSIRPIRNAFFEFFLISHIVLIGIFLLAGWYHARDPGYGDYIWPALVVWAFDRVLRLSRILWNNSVGRSSDKVHSTATVELLSNDTVRLTLRRKHLCWRPGQHAYVILPTVSDIPTEAHPFTIASIPTELDGTSGSNDKKVTFLIRGRSGFTGRLREVATSKGTHTVPAYIDGPYGCPPDLTRFSTCVLIAGGSGVSYILPLLLNLVSQARAGQSAARRVVFVWAVRDPSHLKWISKSLNEALAAAQGTPLTIEPRIYITGPVSPLTEIPSIEYENSSRSSTTGDSTPNSPTLDKIEEKLELPTYSPLKFTHGRPSIPKILQDEISTAAGPVSVDVAGPHTLSQSVARVLYSGNSSPTSVLKGTPSVTLHVETFGMVH